MGYVLEMVGLVSVLNVEGGGRVKAMEGRYWEGDLMGPGREGGGKEMGGMVGLGVSPITRANWGEVEIR